MGFKLPEEKPDLESDLLDWVDYIEFKAALNNSSKVSILETVKEASMILDEVNDGGVNDENDELLELANKVSAEISNRLNLLKNKYPFKLTNKGYTFELKQTLNSDHHIYLYLLMATRMNMKTNKIQNSVDGALIFETLAKWVSKRYWGSNSIFEVVGTGSHGRAAEPFKKQIDRIFKQINETSTYNSNPGYAAKDDKLDLIGWIPFSDMKKGKIVIMGQCKTGTNWDKHVTELNPVAFWKTWTQNESPVVNPIPTFFVVDAIDPNHWDRYAYRAGIIFDRFRIMEYLPKLSLSNDTKLFTAWYNDCLKLFKQ